MDFCRDLGEVFTSLRGSCILYFLSGFAPVSSIEECLDLQQHPDPSVEKHKDKNHTTESSGGEIQEGSGLLMSLFNI